MHNTRMILFRLFYKKYHRSIIEVSQITSLNKALSRFKRLKKVSSIPVLRPLEKVIFTKTYS